MDLKSIAELLASAPTRWRLARRSSTSNNMLLRDFVACKPPRESRQAEIDCCSGSGGGAAHDRLPKLAPIRKCQRACRPG